MRWIFVNLPVADLAVSRGFVTALGLAVDERLSDDLRVCVVLEETVRAVLTSRERFAELVVGEVADARSGTEVMLALSTDTRAEVDVMADAALAHGGGEWTPAQDRGFLYMRSFTDPDGHVWEVVWMDPAVSES